MHQGRRPFIFIERFQHTTKQRRSPQNIPHNKTRNVIGNRSRIGGIRYYGPGGCIHHNNFGGNGTHASPMPLQTNNYTAEVVINGKIQPNQTKDMDMRFHCLRDRECQEQFRIYWRPGKSNYADYWTKHHPSKHHQNTRKEFITPHIVLETLRI